MAYLKSQYREFERIGSDSFQILVAEQALNYLRRAVISKMFLDAYAEAEERKKINLIVNASSSLTACRGRRGMTSGCEYQLGTHHGNL